MANDQSSINESALLEECHSLDIAWLGQYSEDTPTMASNAGSFALYNWKQHHYAVCLLNQDPKSERVPVALCCGTGQSVHEAFSNAAKLWNQAVEEGYWNAHWEGPSETYLAATKGEEE